jgi:hypothetical protein
MLSRLLRSPSFKRVQVQETLAKVDEGRSVVQLCKNKLTTDRSCARKQVTFFHLSTVSSGLEVGHRGLVDDIRECRSLEVLLPRLLIRIPLPGILLDALEPVLLVPVHINVGIEEVAGLFSHIHHVLLRHPV